MRQRENHFSKKEKVFGQFFTPQVVADFIVLFASKFLDRKERGIDPACGDGVFLRSMLDAGFREVWGVDIDTSIVDTIPQTVKERTKIVTGDALLRSSLLSQTLPEDYFDLAVGNPPFSSKYGRVSDKRLSFYKLGKGRTSQAIEVLFLERFLQLVRGGGVVGIILPDGVLSSKNLKYVREFILNNFVLLSVVSLPRGIFRSAFNTTSKTSILFIKKEKPKNPRTLMLEVEDIGELEEFRTNTGEALARGFYVIPTSENLTPRFYKPIQIQFREGLEVKTLGELIEEIRSGATEYGDKRKFATEGLKYISAKVVTPLGLNFKRDTRRVEPNSQMDKKCAYVKPADLLFVRVGVGCSGRAAVVVDEQDVGIADDWIYIVRFKDKELLPYYTAVYIHSKPGRMQIEKMKRGVGTVTIPQSELLTLKIPIPDREFLQAIKEKYIETVQMLRRGDELNAERNFKKLISLVEERIL